MPIGTHQSNGYAVTQSQASSSSGMVLHGSASDLSKDSCLFMTKWLSGEMLIGWVTLDLHGQLLCLIGAVQHMIRTQRSHLWQFLQVSNLQTIPLEILRAATFEICELLQGVGGGERGALFMEMEN